VKLLPEPAGPARNIALGFSAISLNMSTNLIMLYKYNKGDLTNQITPINIQSLN
jgi:hypothetical protein